MKLIQVYDSLDDDGMPNKKIYINIELIDKVTILECEDKTCRIYGVCFMSTERETTYRLATEYRMKQAISFITKNIGVQYDYHNAEVDEE